jgi:lipopolysaccharide/colanic/teichoic acid biosynthesis glycosyltransferase
MELLFAPQIQRLPKKSGERFGFRTYKMLMTGNCQYSGFYYVGKNAAQIERLVNLFDRGYASDGMDTVKQELMRSLEQEKAVLPEVIVCEAGFEVSAILSFRKFLKRHRVLHSIPFLLDGSGLSEKELERYKVRARPDEIIFFDQCEKATLKKKVLFLRRMKEAQNDKAVPQIEENIRSGILGLGFGSKRIFDILVASLALLVLSPIFLLVAFMIKLESKGPVFYISKRAGRGYRIFDFFKFRTMVQDADLQMTELWHLNQYNSDVNQPLFFKVSQDPRITKVGALLRNTSLDELPQLFNVLLGHMSLVGNRPLPLYEAETLTTDAYAARFLAPAGITGLWQVKKRGNKDMSVEERINIDIDYAHRCSFATDLWIIANTPSALIQKENV